MANIVSFRGNAHRRAQLALPWYATGQLDGAECAEVEDHLATCTACREDLRAERDMAARVAGLTFDGEAGWMRLRQRLQQTPRSRRRPSAAETIRRWLAWPGKFGWFVAGQAIAVGLVLILAVPRAPPPAEFHTLGAASAHAPGNAPGNAIIMFRPDASEADMRATLAASGARIVDGPTASGAYVLRIAAERREAILSELRSRKTIILAQPIDADPDR